jgi:hypothetical protein
MRPSANFAGGSRENGAVLSEQYPTARLINLGVGGALLATPARAGGALRLGFLGAASNSPPKVAGIIKESFFSLI